MKSITMLLAICLGFCIPTMGSSPAGAPKHNTKMAIFELHETNGGYVFKAQFDRGPLLNTLFTDCDNQNDLEHCLEKYLIEHLTVQINGESVGLVLDSMAYESDHILCDISLVTEVSEIKTVDAEITTLLNVEEQYNILRIMFGPRVRSFQLNKARTHTHITL